MMYNNSQQFNLKYTHDLNNKGQAIKVLFMYIFIRIIIYATIVDLQNISTQCVKLCVNRQLVIIVARQTFCDKESQRTRTTDPHSEPSYKMGYHTTNDTSYPNVPWVVSYCKYVLREQMTKRKHADAEQLTLIV